MNSPRITKKTVITAAVLLIGGITGHAQSKLSLEALQLTDNVKKVVKTVSDEDVSDAVVEVPTVGILITLAPGSSVADIKINSLAVKNQISNIVIAEIAATDIEALGKSKAVASVELSQKCEEDMIHVRQHAQTGISYVHGNTLSEFERGYRGAGVICSIYDNGLDPNHINFMTGSDYKTSRVKRIYTYLDSDGTVTNAYETPETIATFTTEDSEANHGTHVLGIMAGSYNGKGTYGEYVYNAAEDSIQREGDESTQRKRYVYRDKKIPYYGVAPASDILIGCGELNTNNMLDMAIKVRDYAKEHGQPAVINYSIGNGMGSKDGSSAFSKALAEVGKDIIICFSASNSGDENAWITETLTDSDKSFMTLLLPKKSTKALSSGKLEIWSGDERPFNVTFFTYNKKTKLRCNLVTVNGPTNKSKRVISSNYSHSSESIDYIVNDDFDAAFKGYFTISSNVMAQNNRYELYVSFNSDFTLASNNSDGNIVLGYELTGNSGQRIDANASSDVFTFDDMGQNGFISGTPDMSINDRACGENVFAVGNYISRTWYGILNTVLEGGSTSGKGSSSAIPQDIAPSSSYGTLIDGRKLPHIAAPGQYVVSSNSRYYMRDDANSSGSRYAPANNTAIATVNGEDYYWCVMNGTSMSSPAFAGICALWLEADPTLKWDDIYSIIQTTSRQDEYTQAFPQYFGAGKADAYEGLKEVLRRSSVAPVYNIDERNIMINHIGNNIEVFVGSGETFNASLTDIAGRTIASTRATDNVNFSTSDLQKGIYIVTVENEKIKKSKKIAIQ